MGFQTRRGSGGREGLEPATAWFRTVKWQALAARYVANEMKFNSIWSWGWPEYKTVPGEIDPDKRRAACVYLWTRNPKLCNGPATAGKGFNASRAASTSSETTTLTDGAMSNPSRGSNANASRARSGEK